MGWRWRMHQACRPVGRKIKIPSGRTRSEAAKAGWSTRRRKGYVPTGGSSYTPHPLTQEQRSEIAKKAWKTRKEKEAKRKEVERARSEWELNRYKKQYEEVAKEAAKDEPAGSPWWHDPYLYKMQVEEKGREEESTGCRAPQPYRYKKQRETPAENESVKPSAQRRPPAVPKKNKVETVRHR